MKLENTLAKLENMQEMLVSTPVKSVSTLAKLGSMQEKLGSTPVKLENKLAKKDCIPVMMEYMQGRLDCRLGNYHTLHLWGHMLENFHPEHRQGTRLHHRPWD